MMLKASFILICVFVLTANISLSQSKISKSANPAVPKVENKPKAAVIDTAQLLKAELKTDSALNQQLEEIKLAVSDHWVSRQSLIIAIAGGLLTLWLGILAWFSYKTSADVKETMSEIKKARDIVLEAKEKAESFNNKESEILGKLNGLEQRKTELEGTIGKLHEEFQQRLNDSLKISKLYNNAVAVSYAGGIDTAIEKFKTVVKMDNNHLDAHCKLAMCHSDKGDNTEAMKIVVQLLARPGKIPMAHSTYGVILSRMNENKKALAEFDLALKDGFDEFHTTYSHIGYTHLFLNQYDEAIKAFNDCLRVKTNNSPGTYGKLKTLFLQNPTADHKDLIKLAIERADKDTFELPGNPYPFYGLAFSYLLANKNDGSCLEALKNASAQFRNIGILRWQLFEYEMFKKREFELFHLDSCIKHLKTEIKYIEKFYKSN